MPIIPSNWTGNVTVNAIGIGVGGSTTYAYAKQLNATITELNTFIDLVGVCNESISREVSLDLITGKVKLYWKNLDNTYTQIHKDNLIFNTGYNFIDFTLGQLGLSIKCSEITSLFLVVRWDKGIEFSLYSEPVPTAPLVTVIDNAFYVDQSQVINYPDPVTFSAYFVDVPPITNKPYLYTYFYTTSGDALPDRWIINPSETETCGTCLGSGYILDSWGDLVDCNVCYGLGTITGPDTGETYPTIDNKFIFNFLPSNVTVSNSFYRRWSIPDWKTGDEQLRIISYNDSTKTFILGVIEE